MKVMMLSHKIPPLYGGAGKQAMTLADRLAAKGVEVTMLTARLSRQLPRKERRNGVRVRFLFAGGPHRFRSVVFGFAAATYLMGHNRSYDILHAHGAFLNAIPALHVAGVANKRTVIKLTRMDYDDPLTIVDRGLGQFIMNRLRAADRIIAISDELAASCESAGLSPYQIARIPNGVDVDVFQPVAETTRLELRARFDIPADAPIALFVGYFGGLKGGDVLLQAWRAVHQRFPAARLLLAGPLRSPAGWDTTPYLDSFSHDSVGTVTKDNVHLLGEVDDIHQLYQIADIFVLPSRTEGLSNALLEAMATAVVPVATDVSGNAQVINDGINGVLVSRADEKELAEALCRLIEDPEARRSVGRSARHTIVRDYSLETVASRYLRTYETILASRT